MRRYVGWAAAFVAVGLWAVQARGAEVEPAAAVAPGPDPIVLPHPFTLSINGGAEWYRAGLTSARSPAPAYGVSFQIEPLRFLGLEVGYSGASIPMTGSSTRVDRNGGYAILTPGYSFPIDPQDITDIKPYVFGGIGRDFYSDPPATLGSFPTSWTMPYGVGLRLRFGQFSIDGRFSWVSTFGSVGTFNNLFTSGLRPFRTQALLQAGVNF